MMRSLTRAAALAALLCVPAMQAQAQLGGLIKKAAGKVVEDKKNEMKAKATEKPLEGDPVTASALDGVLKGLSLELEQQNEAVRLKAIQEKKSEAWNKAYEAGREEAEKYRESNEKVLSCISEELGKIQEQHSSEMMTTGMTMVSTPEGQAKLKEMTELAPRISEAASKGDTATQRRLYDRLMKLIGVDMHADSVAAQKTCGKPPAPPASYVLTERLASELRDANEALRKVEVDLSDKAAQVAGMPQKDYFLARERIWSWNHARANKSGTGGVTKDEDALFRSRASEIQKVEKALR